MKNSNNVDSNVHSSENNDEGGLTGSIAVGEGEASQSKVDGNGGNGKGQEAASQSSAASVAGNDNDASASSSTLLMKTASAPSGLMSSQVFPRLSMKASLPTISATRYGAASGNGLREGTEEACGEAGESGEKAAFPGRDGTSARRYRTERAMSAFSKGKHLPSHIEILRSTLLSITEEELRLGSSTAFTLSALNNTVARKPNVESAPKIGLKQRMKSFVLRRGLMEPPNVRLDHHVIELGTIEAMSESISFLTCQNLGKHKCFLRPFNALGVGEDSANYTIRFEPVDSDVEETPNRHYVVRKRTSFELRITVVPGLGHGTGHEANEWNLVVPIGIEFAAGPRLLAVVRGKVVRPCFGVDPAGLPCAAYQGRNIPELLLKLQHYLESCDAYKIVGIFRLAGNIKEMSRLRIGLSKGVLAECEEIHSVSTLIKVFFRELPRPLFASLSDETLMSIPASEEEGIDTCESIAEMIEEPQRALLEWLVDLMADVAELQETNKMSPKNCAIVMGPNLYVSPVSANPMNSLIFSQKAVLLFQHLVSRRIQERERRRAKSES